MPGTINVSSLNALYTALASARNGETILLEGGDYGSLNLSTKSGFNVDFPSNVTIASADPDNPARFSRVDVRDASNLTFDGITFDYDFAAGDKIYDRPFSFSRVENITIRNSIFDGDVAQGVSAVDDGYSFGVGLALSDTTGVSLENNAIFGFHRGLTAYRSADLRIVGNDVYDIRSDGMNFAQVQNVLIEDNYIHDFRASPNSADHRDMIQIWTAGTNAPSTDIIIRGNKFDIGLGDDTQTIFMRNDRVDQGLAGKEMFYRNVLIEDNVINNAHLNGIVVGETDGLVIRSNSVLHADGRNADGLDGNVEIPRIRVAGSSENVTIANNATSALNGWTGQSGWAVSNNAFIQDQNPNAPGYYGDVFVLSSLQPQDGVNNFKAMPGGMLALLQAGASETLTSATGDIADGGTVIPVPPLPDPEEQVTPTPAPKEEATPTSPPEEQVTPTPAPKEEATPTSPPEEQVTPTPNPIQIGHGKDVKGGHAKKLPFQKESDVSARDVGESLSLAIADTTEKAGIDFGGASSTKTVHRDNVSDSLGKASNFEGHLTAFSLGLASAAETGSTTASTSYPHPEEEITPTPNPIHIGHGKDVKGGQANTLPFQKESGVSARDVGESLSLAIADTTEKAGIDFGGHSSTTTVHRDIVSDIFGKASNFEGHLTAFSLGLASAAETGSTTASTSYHDLNLNDATSPTIFDGHIETSLEHLVDKVSFDAAAVHIMMSAA